MLFKKAFVFTLSILLGLGSVSSPVLAHPWSAISVIPQGSNTGRLVGTVLGPDGAVIAGAEVAVTDNQNSKEYKLVTSTEGLFAIPQLEVGTYTVTVAAQGFKTFTATALKVDVGKDYSLNVTLEVGNISETVTVSAGAEIVNATNAELSNTVGPRQIQELPLNGRNPLALIGLQAGTSQNGATSTSINGQRTSFTNITRDGINVQDNFIRSNATDFIPDRPNVGDIGEFSIVTQNAGAELGYGSSQVQLVTRRGSNEYHGSAFITNRNSEFAANSFFRNATKTPKPFLNRNEYGGSFGGPFPFKKDKLFFFGSFEGFKLRQSTLTTRTILFPQAGQGAFTYRDSAGALRSLNVLSLAGVPLDPTVKGRILDKLPTSGNRADIGDNLNTTGFSFNQANGTDREAVTARFDYEINSKQTINGVYSYRHDSNQRPDVDDGGFNATPFGTQDANTHFVSVAWRWNPTNTFTNELRGGLQFSDPKFDRTDQPADFFISVPLISSAESTFQQQGRNTKIFNVQDNAVLSKGAHSFRFGGLAQIFRIKPFGPPAFSQSTIPTLVLGTNVNTPSLAASQFPGGISSTQLNNANALLGLLGGIVSSANLAFNVKSQTSGFISGLQPRRRLNYENFAFYFADSWRVKPQLTVNLGLRYELYLALREPNGLALEPVIPAGTPAAAALLDPNGAINFVGANAGGNRFFKTDRDNFAPVLSVAYSPNFGEGIIGKIFPGDGKTVFRGGFRVSYVNDEFVRAADNALTGNQGLTQQVSLVNLNSRFNSLPGFATPAFQVPRTFAQNNTLAGNFGTAFAIDPNLQVPRTLEWNFGIQRDIGWRTAIEVRYVGGMSNSLARASDLNQVDIRGNGFVNDFIRARNNLVLTGNPACTSAGCQPLTVFPNLVSGGLLNNSTIRTQLLNGTPADLAVIYVTNRLTGTVNFLRNPNTGVADLLTNSARYRYNSLQAEIRRQLGESLYFQANYTFQKTLTDAAGVGQTRFDPFLDNAAPGLEYARADFDQTHVFNVNALYDLPFGKGRRFFAQGGWRDRLISGWTVTSIIRASTGAPLTFTDPRGTLNRAGRSGRQTATSSLSTEQIKDLIGVFRTPNGVFFIKPSVINPGTGRGAEGFGSTPFSGQAFFNAAPGQTSNLARAFFDGPKFVNLNASVIKNISLKERVSAQLRLEVFNVLNRTNFFVGQFGANTNINSTSFGKITTDFGPRIVQLVGRIQF